MDIPAMLNISLAGLAVIGVVNLLTMYAPQMEAKTKILIAFMVAFTVSFVPADLGNIILNHLRTAIEVTFISSGVYKLAQKSGGDGRY